MQFFRLLALSVQFMTRIPIKMEYKASDKDFGAMTAFFPAPAAIVGAAMGAVFWLFGLAGLHWAGAALCVAAACLITGGLHLDGFADTADAFGAGKGKKKTLEILKDTHMGAYGVLAVVFAVLLKVLLIGSLPHGAFLLAAGAPLAGKIPLAVAAAAGRYPREQGTGKHTIDHVKTRHSAVCVAVCGALLYLCGGWPAMPALGGLIASGFIWAAVSKKKAGGVTGDVLGAANETGELIWLCFAALWCAVL